MTEFEAMKKRLKNSALDELQQERLINYFSPIYYEAQEKDDYAKELADVIICVLIAAKHDSINIEKALQDCQQKNEARAMEGSK